MEKFENRLICFLDVLGFSSMVQKMGIDELYGKYSEFVDLAKNRVFFGVPDDYSGPSNNFEISEIVSDSILLVSHDISDIASVNNFIGSISFFMELGLESSFMFRGCIGQGDIIYDDDRRIFLSEEFNRLAKYEPVLDSPVCVVSDSAKATVISSLFGDKARSKGVLPSKSLPVIKWDVPLKNEEVKDFWCVNYTYFNSEKHLSLAKDFLSGDPVKKENFIAYLNYLDSIPEDFLHDGAVNNERFIKLMRSRSGMRVAFSDSSGEIVQKPIHWGFPAVFVEPPSKIQMHVNPATGAVSFNVEGRWY